VTEAVIDTNVLVSAALTPQGACGEVVDLVFAGEICPVLDDRVIAEYTDVLTRFRMGFPPALVSSMLDALLTAGRHAVVVRAHAQLPDESDRCFFECALACASRFLVTGNKKHFPGAARAGVILLSPRELLDRLRDRE
jgi:putative PIN family toxin of toxin-antitoxin system